MQGNTVKVAVQIDCDNTSPYLVSDIMNIARGYGVVCAARAYGDFSNPTSPWPNAARGAGIQPIHHAPIAKRKNGVDIAMAIDAMDLLHGGHDVYVIVSSDTDFTALVHRIRAAGKICVGIGKAEASEIYRLACTEYHALSVVSAAAESPYTKAAEEVRSRCAVICRQHGGIARISDICGTLAKERLWPRPTVFGTDKLGNVLAGSPRFGLFQCRGEIQVVLSDHVQDISLLRLDGGKLIIKKQENLGATTPVIVPEARPVQRAVEALEVSSKTTSIEPDARAKYSSTDPKRELHSAIVAILAAALPDGISLETLRSKLRLQVPGFSCGKYGYKTMRETVESIVDDVVFDRPGSCAAVSLDLLNSKAA